MKKLDLNALAVDTFATAPAAAPARGTILAQAANTLSGCPVSWNGTCFVTCACDTVNASCP